MSESAHMPQKTMLALGFLSGLGIFVLGNVEDWGVWPGESPLWLYPLWTLVLLVPLILLLSIEEDNKPKLLRYVGGYAAVMAVLGMYIGFQGEPWGEFRVEDMTVVYALTMALASFKALMYIQQRSSGQPMTYDVLFTYSWRNFLTGVLAGGFVFAFWLILLLWGELFKAIGVMFFRDLFREDWFHFPVLGVAAATGIIIFRKLTHVIDTITRLLQALIKFLLPLVIGIGALFILSLPFVGLDALWDTGSGTALLLWLLALSLFFVNAVYQDGRESHPYPQIVHRLIYGGLALMPIVSILSLYGLWLRLDQYGWTVERAWAFVTWLILSLFAFGYLYGIVKKRDGWTTELARVNTGMGLVVLVVMLLTNSPVVDFRKLSAASQLARVESGATDVLDFDFRYAYQTLARAGYLVVEDIRQQYAADNPELEQRIEDHAWPRTDAQRMTVDEFFERVRFIGEVTDVPENLRQTIFSAAGGFGDDVTPYIVAANLDGDEGLEYVLLSTYGTYISNTLIFDETDEGWKHHQAYASDFSGGSSQTDDLESGDVSVHDPRFRNLRIGDVTIRPTSD